MDWYGDTNSVYSNPNVLYSIRFFLHAVPAADAHIEFHFGWNIPGSLLCHWLPEKDSDEKPRNSFPGKIKCRAD